MIFKNIAGQGIYVYAHDTVADAAKTGDAANITASISKEGAAGIATNDVNPTEIGGGVYHFDLMQAETNCNRFCVYAVSATSDVQIDPIIALTQRGAIPDAAPATDGGLPTVDAFNNITGIMGTKNQLDDLADVIGPTVAEFDARTLPAASYFDPSADAVASVMLVDTVTSNTDMRGTDGANTVAPATAAAIAIAVEGAILNEADGQQVIDAMVQAIGNTNVDSGVLVGLIRADLERASGLLDQILIDTADLQSTKAARATATGFATPANVAAVENKVDAVAVKTINLPADPAGVSDLPVAAPTVGQIDAQLSGVHGAESWVDAGGGGAAPTVQQIDAELTAQHGAGAWAGSSGGSGANAIAVTVTDGSNPIEGAQVRMYKTGFNHDVTADAAGLANFGLDAATWNVVITAPNHSFAPTTLVVAANAAVTLAMTADVVVSPPVDVSMCRVTGWLETLAGAVGAGGEVKFRLVVPSAGAAKSERVIYGREIAVVADVNGFIDVELQRNDLMTPAGTHYEVYAADMGWRWVSLSLVSANVDLGDLVV